ncbi:hypothetical protein [Bacillus pinisoli]|uniref:hypothetical protein n=1 Tax=Bacillus pinisoli TaxID=2901866 RepID=UPI001FF2A008|nr:hypothetical protein [Bacillus pinisoli]
MQNMNKNDLQACIEECESALSHLQKAMGKMTNEKLQHAARDLEDCISECRSML